MARENLLKFNLHAGEIVENYAFLRFFALQSAVTENQNLISGLF
jgi:hypothetical protein